MKRSGTSLEGMVEYLVPQMRGRSMEKAFKGMKDKTMENVIKNFRAPEGAHRPNHAETTQEGIQQTWWHRSQT